MSQTAPVQQLYSIPVGETIAFDTPIEHDNLVNEGEPPITYLDEDGQSTVDLAQIDHELVLNDQQLRICRGVQALYEWDDTSDHGLTKRDFLQQSAVEILNTAKNQFNLDPAIAGMGVFGLSFALLSSDVHIPRRQFLKFAAILGALTVIATLTGGCGAATTGPKLEIAPGTKLTPEQISAIVEGSIMTLSAPIRDFDTFLPVQKNLKEIKNWTPVAMEMEEGVTAFTNLGKISQRYRYIALKGTDANGASVIIDLATAKNFFKEQPQALETILRDQALIAKTIGDETHLPALLQQVISEKKGVELPPAAFKKSFLFKGNEIIPGVTPGLEFTGIQLRGQGQVMVIITKEGGVVGTKNIPITKLNLPPKEHFPLRHLRDTNASLALEFQPHTTRLLSGERVTIGEFTGELQIGGKVTYPSGMTSERGLITVFNSKGEAVGLFPISKIESSKVPGSYIFPRGQGGYDGAIDRQSLSALLENHFNDIFTANKRGMKTELNIPGVQGGNVLSRLSLDEIATSVASRLQIKALKNIVLSFVPMMILSAATDLVATRLKDLGATLQVIEAANMPASWLSDTQVRVPSIGSLNIDIHAFDPDVIGRAHSIPFFSSISTGDIVQDITIKPMLLSNGHPNLIPKLVAYFPENSEDLAITQFYKPGEEDAYANETTMYLAVNESVACAADRANLQSESVQTAFVPTSTQEVTDTNYLDLIIRSFQGENIPGFNLLVAKKPASVQRHPNAVGYEVFTIYNGKLYALYFFDEAPSNTSYLASIQ